MAPHDFASIAMTIEDAVKAKLRNGLARRALHPDDGWSARMRFITGLVFGIILTIGTVYVADAMRAPSGPDDKPGAQRMVNWDVVSGNLGVVSTGVRQAWDRLVGGAKDIDRKAERTGT